MGRPLATPAPVFAAHDAAAAARAIRDGRLDAGDPDARYLPSDARLDDDDFDRVLEYCETHRDGIARRVLDAELKHRAVLWAYREQLARRAARRRERQKLALLEDGRRRGRGVPWPFGPLGLTRQAAYNLRTRWAARPEPASAEAVPALVEWLDAHRCEVSEVGEQLVDERPSVLVLVVDVERRVRVAELVDAVGQALAPRPTVEFAGLVVSALDCWLEARPVTADPVLRDLILRGQALVETHSAARGE